jgi:hypothetical protein
MFHPLDLFFQDYLHRKQFPRPPVNFGSSSFFSLGRKALYNLDYARRIDDTFNKGLKWIKNTFISTSIHSYSE